MIDSLMKRLLILAMPGLGLKRWSVLLVTGLGIFGIGVAFALAEPLSPKILPILRALTLNSVPTLLRGAIFILIGLGMAGFATFQIYRLLVSGVVWGRGRVDVLTALEQKRRHGRGMRVVAIGGGTGLSVLLRGLKSKTSNLTAIVTISDDGGSSGRLRDDLNIPPPGDARNCLVALSRSEPILEELFNYRFSEGSSLNGHNLGNLFLAALIDTRGGFQESLEAAAELLGLSGQVVPVSNRRDVVLVAETVSGEVLRGESAVASNPKPLRRLWLEPEQSGASDGAIEAVLNAEMIVIGPGSLYTSVISNFLVEGLSEAVRASPALKVFVCNVATQPNETISLSASRHLLEFQKHSGVSADFVVINNDVIPPAPDSGQAAVLPESWIEGFKGNLIEADVVDTSFPTRHDPRKLTEVLFSIAR